MSDGDDTWTHERYWSDLQSPRLSLKYASNKKGKEEVTWMSWFGGAHMSEVGTLEWSE